MSPSLTEGLSDPHPAWSTGVPSTSFLGVGVQKNLLNGGVTSFTRHTCWSVQLNNTKQTEMSIWEAAGFRDGLHPRMVWPLMELITEDNQAGCSCQHLPNSRQSGSSHCLRSDSISKGCKSRSRTSELALEAADAVPGLWLEHQDGSKSSYLWVPGPAL